MVNMYANWPGMANDCSYHQCIFTSDAQLRTLQSRLMPSDQTAARIVTELTKVFSVMGLYEFYIQIKVPILRARF